MKITWNFVRNKLALWFVGLGTGGGVTSLVLGGGSIQPQFCVWFALLIVGAYTFIFTED